MILHTIISEDEVMAGYKEGEYSLYMNDAGEVSGYKAGNGTSPPVYITNPRSFLKACSGNSGFSEIHGKEGA